MLGFCRDMSIPPVVVVFSMLCCGGAGDVGGDLRGVLLESSYFLDSVVASVVVEALGF